MSNYVYGIFTGIVLSLVLDVLLTIAVIIALKLWLKRDPTIIDRGQALADRLYRRITGHSFPYRADVSERGYNEDADIPFDESEVEDSDEEAAEARDHADQLGAAERERDTLRHALEQARAEFYGIVSRPHAALEIIESALRATRVQEDEHASEWVQATEVVEPPPTTTEPVTPPEEQ